MPRRAHCVLVASASAQPMAYVATTADVPCGPYTTGPCTRGAVAILNTATNHVERTIELWTSSNTAWVSALAVHPDNTRLYVWASSYTMLLYVYSTATGELLKWTTIGYGYGVDCAWAADNRRLLCSIDGRFAENSSARCSAPRSRTRASA